MAITYPRPTSQHLAIGYLLAAGLLLAIGWLSFRSLEQLVASQGRVSHAQVVLVRLERVISLLKDAETAQRGYLLTGEEPFLGPLRFAERQTQREQRALDSLVAGSAGPRRRLDTLRILTAAHFASLEGRLAAFRRTARFDVAELRQSKARLDQLRGLIGRWQAAERAGLGQREARTAASVRTTLGLVVGLAALALALLGLAAWYLHRSRRAEDRAHRTIDEQEVTLQGLVQASLDGVSLYDWEPATGAGGDFRLCLFNDAAERLVPGHTQHLGCLLSELFPASVTSGRLAHYQQVMATGQPWETEFYMEPQQLWLRVVAARVNNKLFSTFADITARKQQEKVALDYEQRKFEAVFSQSNQLLALLDAEGHLLDVNAPALALMGQLAGKPGRSLASFQASGPFWQLPGTSARLRASIERAAQGETVRYDTALQPVEGQSVYLDFSCKPVRSTGGDILFLLLESRDITERVLAREALQASYQQQAATTAELHALSLTLEERVAERTRLLADSRARFAQLLESIPNMAWTALPDGTIDYYNQRWAEVTGASVAELRAGGWQPHIHPDDLAPTAAAWQQAIATGQPLAELRNRWRHATDGDYRWHLVRAAPLCAPDGTLLLWVGTATDIHNQQLQQQHLERVNRDLDSFIYTASHDLHTPISNIEGLLNALREELALPPEEASLPPLLLLMQHSVDRFKRTIANLTNVVRLEKSLDQPLADVDLAALVDDVRQDLRPLLAATGGQLLADVAACPILAFAEKNLRSIVFNLLSNALKYRHPDRVPRVRLCCRPAGTCALLTVQDNGLGLESGREHKIFGLFQRLHDHVEGSGLGLYMVKKIVDNAGGRIEVDSTLDVGTTFRVYLPR